MGHTSNASVASRSPRRRMAVSSHRSASRGSLEMDRYSLPYPPTMRFLFSVKEPSDSSELYAVRVRLPRPFTNSGNRSGSSSMPRHSAWAMAFCGMMCSIV